MKWFGHVDLSLATVPQVRVVRAVDELLHQLQPARLDPVDQFVGPERGETWIKLRHDTDPTMIIDLVLSDGWANFYGVMGHDEAYNDRSDPADAWESETIDVLAGLLQAAYTTTTYTLRDRPWREELTFPDQVEHVVMRPLVWYGHLPLGRWAAVAETRRASFECRGARPGKPSAD